MPHRAGIAQLVEPHVANVVVAGSSPVSRSKVFEERSIRAWSRGASVYPY